MSASLSTVLQNIASYLWCSVCMRWSIAVKSKQVYWSLRYWVSVYLRKICSTVWISPQGHWWLSYGIQLHCPVSTAPTIKSKTYTYFLPAIFRSLFLIFVKLGLDSAFSSQQFVISSMTDWSRSVLAGIIGR